MSCPTCGHTMEGLLQNSVCCAIKTFICPRCGTMKHESGERVTYDIPKLVERCRAYQKEFGKENIAQYYRNEWKRLGITESINMPENR